jgi:hypothetical protein
MVFNNPAISAIILFIVFTVLIIIIKPSFVYDYRNNKFKDFGFGKNKTIMPLPILCIFVGIVSYGIFFYFTSPNKIIQQIGSGTPAFNYIKPPQYYPQQLLRYPNYYNPQQFIPVQQNFIPDFE